MRSIPPFFFSVDRSISLGLIWQLWMCARDIPKSLSLSPLSGSRTLLGNSNEEEGREIERFVTVKVERRNLEGRKKKELFFHRSCT